MSTTTETKGSADVIQALAGELAEQFAGMPADGTLLTTDNLFTLLHGDFLYAGVYREPTQEELADLIVQVKAKLAA